MRKDSSKLLKWDEILCGIGITNDLLLHRSWETLLAAPLIRLADPICRGYRRRRRSLGGPRKSPCPSRRPIMWGYVRTLVAKLVPNVTTVRTLSLTAVTLAAVGTVGFFLGRQGARST